VVTQTLSGGAASNHSRERSCGPGRYGQLVQGQSDSPDMPTGGANSARRKKGRSVNSRRSPYRLEGRGTLVGARA
jgi:hypothetical protein